MATASSQCCRIAFFVDGLLFLQQGSHRLEGHAEVDVLPVADAALNAAAVIGDRRDSTTGSFP